MPITEVELAWAKAAFEDRVATYKLAKDYYHGVHNLSFATPKFNKAFGSLFATFAYNRCAPVVDAIANSLHVTGWNVYPVDLGNAVINESPGADAAAQATGPDLGGQAMNLWRLAGMDKREGELYTESVMTGDAYAVVWYDSPPPLGTGLPMVWPQRAEQMRVRWDDDGRINLAAKSWKITAKGHPYEGRIRLTFYTPLDIIRLVTTGKSDELKKNLTDYELVKEVNYLGQPVENPVLHTLGRPPVVHYPNNAPMTGDYGLSQLRDVIPLQDALNKAIADMLVAMEFNSYPQRFATGISPPEKDPETGKYIVPWKQGPGEIWFSTEEGAKFGNFEAGQLDQFIHVAEAFDVDIARVSHIPIFWLLQSGTPPSGESNKTASAPFTSLLEDRQRSFGANHGETMGLMFRLLTNSADPLLIEPDWESAEPRSQREMIEMGEIAARAGLPLHIVGQIMGLDPEQQAELAAQAEAEAASQEAALASMAGAVVGQQLQGAVAEETPA
jgi:hypothetical protein